MIKSIYGFRGSYDNYFEQLSNEYDVKRISLNTNYRSTNQIIDVSEALIKPQRDVHSEKDLKGNRDIDFRFIIFLMKIKIMKQKISANLLNI